MSPRSRASEPAATVCGRHLVTRSIAVPGSLSGGLRDRHLESEGLELADVAARGAVRMSPVEIVRTEFLVSSTVAHDRVLHHARRCSIPGTRCGLSRPATFGPRRAPPRPPTRGPRIPGDDHEGRLTEIRVLRWIGSPDGVRKQWPPARWRGFVATSKALFAFDPEKDGQIVAVERLVSGSGPWEHAWNRYREAPNSFAGVRARP